MHTTIQINKATITAFMLFAISFAACNNREKEIKSTETNKLDQEKIIDLNLMPEKADGPIDEDVAHTMSTQYRAGVAVEKTNGIWYEMKDVKEFIDTVLLKNIEKIKPPQDYKWKLAMSPIYVKKSNRARLSICFLPTLVHDRDSSVIDFFDHKAIKDTFYTNYYVPLLNLCKRDKTNGSIIYDEGQLWP